jgi:hypothetical protein
MNENQINACVPFYTRYVDISYKDGVQAAREWLSTLPELVQKGVDWIICGMNFEAPKGKGVK